MDTAGTEESEEDRKIRILKHDIKNQLSNIVLAVSQLEFEMTDITEDQHFYLTTVSDSCKRINSLLGDI